MFKHFLDRSLLPASRPGRWDSAVSDQRWARLACPPPTRVPRAPLLPAALPCHPGKVTAASVCVQGLHPRPGGISEMDRSCPLITISIYINGSAFLVVWLGGMFSRLTEKSTAPFDEICPFWEAAGAERLCHRWSINTHRPLPALGGERPLPSSGHLARPVIPCCIPSPQRGSVTPSAPHSRPLWHLVSGCCHPELGNWP